MARHETFFTGDTKDIDRKLTQLGNRMARYEQQARKVNTTASKSFNQTSTSVAALSTSLKTLAPIMAGAFSAKALQNITDTWTDYQSRVRLAIDETENAADVMDRLADIANKSYNTIDTTAEGFLSAASTLKLLGASTNGVLDYTEALNNAMVVSGAKAERAARVQDALGKAMASGKLSGSELNTVIETGGRVAELLAQELGVSTLELRKMGKDGKITADVIYNSLTKNLSTLRAEAESMDMTVGDAFLRLQNNIIQYIGTTDQALGVSAKFAEVIVKLADNLDVLAKIAMVGVAVAGARGIGMLTNYAVAATAAGISTARLTAFQVGMQASMTGVTRASLLATTAMNGLNASMAFFGGPIGLAITAIAAAVYVLHQRTSAATRESKALAKVTSDLTTAKKDYESATKAAAEATEKDKKAALENAAAKRQEYVDTLNAAKAKIEDAKASIANARAKIQAAQFLNKANKVLEGQSGGDGITQIGRWGARHLLNAASGQLSGEAQNQSNQAIDALNGLTAELNGLKPDEGITSINTTEDGKDKKNKGSSGPSDTDRARNGDDLMREFTRRSAAIQAELAGTLEARHALALQQLDWERDDAKESLSRQLADKQITKATYDEALIKIDGVHAEALTLEKKKQETDLAEQALQRLRDDNDHAIEIARANEDIARLLAEGADTHDQKLRADKRAFEAQQTAERASFEAREAEIEARLRLNGELTAEAEERARQRRELFNRQQDIAKENFNEQQNEQNPFYAYVKQAGNTSGQVQDMIMSSVTSLEDGITGAIMQTERLGDVFKNVANQIIADLVRIAVKQAIMAPLLNMMGLGGAAGGAAGAGGGFLSGIGKLFGFQNGTNFAPGGLAMVGEAGPELVNLPRGSQVVPHRNVDKLLEGDRQMVRGGSNVALNINVDANNAVLADQIRREVAAASMGAVEQARQLAQQDAHRRQSRSTRR
nr:tape measure protein [Brevundimonas naejangsanensis]